MTPFDKDNCRVLMDGSERQMSSLSVSADEESATPKALPAKQNIFTRNPLIRDVTCSVVCVLLAVLHLKLWSFAVQMGFVASKVSRKMIHCSSAPLFVVVWRFYSQDERARLIAAAVPILNITRMYLSTAGMATAVSRSGDAQEVLRGPLLYTYVILGCTLLGFRSTSAVVALSQMAVGDGLAEIVGCRFGTIKWYFNEDKSYAGSLAFVIGASIASVVLLRWLRLVSFVSRALVAKVVCISIVCAFVEVLPIYESLIGVVDDNIAVPVVGAVLGYLFIKPTRG